MRRIDGVVVLYNPDATVIGNIQSYAPQLETLYVVDNSEQSNEAIIAQLHGMPQCRYIDNPTNQGIAQALNTGAKLALENGAEWLLTMDQDSKFEPGDFVKLCEFTKKLDDKVYGIVSPFHKTRLTANLKNETDEVLTTMTSGNLVSLFAYQTIGGYDADYFIDAVDWDFCLRLNQANFKVLRVNTIPLNHNLGNATSHSTFSRKEVIVLNYNPVRRYYITRNKLMIIARFYEAYPKFSYAIFKTLFRDFRHIVLYEKHKSAKLGAMAKGILHFFLNKKGKQL